MSVVVFLFMSAARALGKLYRQKWLERTLRFRTPGFDYDVSHLQQARGAQWVCETLDTLLGWSYYIIGGAALVNIVFVPPIRGAEGPKIPLWIALFALQIAAVAMLLGADHKRDDDQVVGLRRIPHAADESFSSRHGLRVRDNLTGLRSTEYWIHGLELRLRRMIFRCSSDKRTGEANTIWGDTLG